MIPVNLLPFGFELGESVGDAFAWVLTQLGKFFYGFLDDAGLTIDSLMYGVDQNRTEGYFNLGKGNIYGVLGANLFVATRNIFLILIGVVMMYSLLRAALSPVAMKMLVAKGALYNVALSLLLVAWTPGILQFFLWLRSFLLRTVVSSMMMSGNESLYHMYKSGADEDLGQAVLLIAFVLIGLYFAFYYITIAIMQAIMLGVLPIIALQSVNDNGKLKSWYQTFLGWMLIPMVDYVIFLVPIGLLNQGSSSLVILISMFALLPVRKYVFGKLGIEGDVAGIVAGGVSSSIGNLAKKTIDKIKKDHDSRKETSAANKADAENAELHDEFAKNESGGGEVSPRFSDDGDTPSTTSDNDSTPPSDAGSRIEDGDAGTDNPSDMANGVGDGGYTSDTPIDGGASGNNIGDNPNDYSDNSYSSNGYGNGGSGREPQVDAIYQKHATVDNFDKDGYRGHLTHEQMADFYRQRKQERHAVRNAVGRTVGTIAGAGLGMAGMAAGAFYGPSGANTGMNVGFQIGSELPFATGKAAGAAFNVLKEESGRINRSRAAMAAMTVPMDFATGNTSEPDIPIPSSYGSTIGSYEYDRLDGGPTYYQELADNSVPETNFSSGSSADAWLSSTYDDGTAYLAKGVGDALSESVTFDASSLSVVDMLDGAAMANGMIDAGEVPMYFSNSYQDESSPQLKYGSVGNAQMATAYLRNSDGSAYAKNADELKREMEAIRQARDVAIRHTTVVNGNVTQSPWTSDEVAANKVVLSRVAASASVLRANRESMRRENNGISPVIAYRHQQDGGKEYTVGRQLYNPRVDKIVSRPATDDQQRRAESIDKFFEEK